MRRSFGCLTEEGPAIETLALDEQRCGLTSTHYCACLTVMRWRRSLPSIVLLLQPGVTTKLGSWRRVGMGLSIRGDPGTAGGGRSTGLHAGPDGRESARDEESDPAGAEDWECTPAPVREGGGGV